MATVSNKSEATCEQVYRLLKKLTKDNPVTIPNGQLAIYYAHKHALDAIIACAERIKTLQG